MMQRIHSSHLGISGCLRRAKEYVYWPGMHAELTQYIQSCETCQMFESKQQKETLIPHDVPDRPWAKVGTDLCSFSGNDYLVTVDYFSNFWEIDFLENTKPTTVIRKLRNQFARYGIPDTVMSDNGPHFSCKEFAKFANEYGFHHITSSPKYPQSNGKVENAVKSAKRIMKRARNSHQDVYLSILDFRNTPTEGMQSSPAQRLMCRRTKSRLPTTHTLLEPKIPFSAHSEIKWNKNKQCQFYNRNSKDLPEIENGQRVWISPKRDDPLKTWTKGTVTNKVNIRSYEVNTDEGQTFRRNRRDIRVNRGQSEPPLQPVDMEFSETRDTESSVPLCETRPLNQPTESSVEREPQIEPNLPQQTKSGRVVKLPSKYRDFVSY